jgi:hypothetical protein
MKKWRSHQNGNVIFLIHLGAVPIISKKINSFLMKKWRSHQNGNAIFLIHLGAVPIISKKINLSIFQLVIVVTQKNTITN